MPYRKRLQTCGCIGLAVASFALVGAIVAQSALSALWSPQASDVSSKQNARSLTHGRLLQALCIEWLD